MSTVAELLQWGKYHKHEKCRQFAELVTNLIQASKTDAERTQELAKMFQNQAVQLWVSARLNQELANVMNVNYTTAAEIHDSIMNCLHKVLQEAASKSVPAEMIQDMYTYFTQSIKVNDQPLFPEDYVDAVR